MIIKKYPAPPIETAAKRYDRDYKNIPLLDTDGNPDDRHTRILLEQTVERKSRHYVDDGVSAVTGGAPIFDSTVPGDSTPVDPGDNGGGTPVDPVEPGSYSETYSETY